MLVSLEEYYEGGNSICRNPVIQKMFVFTGIGEKAGSGADTIQKGWRDNSWNVPIIIEKFNPDVIKIILSMNKNNEKRAINLSKFSILSAKMEKQMLIK